MQVHARHDTRQFSELSNRRSESELGLIGKYKRLTEAVR
jgi:hypothetical protein